MAAGDVSDLALRPKDWRGSRITHVFVEGCPQPIGAGFDLLWQLSLIKMGQVYRLLPERCP